MVKKQQGVDGDVKGVERAEPEVGSLLEGSGRISHWVEITPLNKQRPEITQRGHAG